MPLQQLAIIIGLVALYAWARAKQFGCQYSHHCRWGYDSHCVCVLAAACYFLCTYSTDFRPILLVAESCLLLIDVFFLLLQKPVVHVYWKVCFKIVCSAEGYVFPIPFVIVISGETTHYRCLVFEIFQYTCTCTRRIYTED